MSEVLESAEEAIPHRPVILSPSSHGNNNFSCHHHHHHHHHHKSPNPFDESVTGYVDEDEVEEEDPAPPGGSCNGEVKGGSRRGTHRGGYLEEPAEPPGSMLSVIPEESVVEVQLAESHDNSAHFGSHDLSLESHDQGINGGQEEGAEEEGEGEGEGEEGGQLPWYHDETSQDVWRTTPAYHRKEVWSHEEETDDAVPRARKLSSVQQVVVTEEIKPVLQVCLELPS